MHFWEQIYSLFFSRGIFFPLRAHSSSGRLCRPITQTGCHESYLPFDVYLYILKEYADGEWGGGRAGDVLDR